MAGFLSTVFGGGSVSSPNITGAQGEGARQQNLEDFISDDQYFVDGQRLRDNESWNRQQLDRERTGTRQSINREAGIRSNLNQSLDATGRTVADTVARDADDARLYGRRSAEDAARFETGVDTRTAQLGADERARSVQSGDMRRAGVQGSLDYGADMARDEAMLRQQFIDAAMADADSAFSGYDDAFFDKHTQGYIDAYKPGIEQNFQDNRRGSVYSLSDKGNLRSSAAAKVFGRLAEKRAADEAQLANTAVDRTAALRGQVNAQRMAAQQQAKFAAMLAPLPAVEGAAPGGFKMAPAGATGPGPQMQPSPVQTRQPVISPAAPAVGGQLSDRNGHKGVINHGGGFGDTYAQAAILGAGRAQREAQFAPAPQSGAWYAPEAGPQAPSSMERMPTFKMGGPVVGPPKGAQAGAPLRSSFTSEQLGGIDPSDPRLSMTSTTQAATRRPAVQVL